MINKILNSKFYIKGASSKGSRMFAWGVSRLVDDGVVVYQCVVCGRAFTKKVSLMAHIRHHKDADLMVFNVKLPKDLVLAFKDLCRRHHTTTCHLVATFMRTVLAGEKVGVVNVGAANPLIVTVNEYFPAVPRSRRKYGLGAIASKLAGFEGSGCFFCGQPALIECCSPGLNPVKLCGRHLHYKSGFMQYRVVK